MTFAAQFNCCDQSFTRHQPMGNISQLLGSPELSMARDELPRYRKWRHLARNAFRLDYITFSVMESKRGDMYIPFARLEDKHNSTTLLIQLNIFSEFLPYDTSSGSATKRSLD